LRLAVVSSFLDRHHGTERALSELIERLARDYGCEIHLFAQRVEDLPVARWDRKHPSREAAIFWHRVPALGGPLLFDFASWYFLNRVWRWAFSFFRRYRFDFVLSPGINCSDADVVIVHAIFYRLRQLARERGEAISPSSGPLRRAHRRIYYWLLNRLERRIYTDPAVVLAAVSHRTAGQLATFFHRGDVHVVPNGVDTIQFSPSLRLSRRAEARSRRNLRPSDFLLLLIGNDWGVKGLPAILHAMAASADLPIHLLIVGADAPEPFQELSKSLGLSARCFWEPPANAVLDFYAAADLYVSPSREDSFGLPVAEAMACGLPAITSVFAGVADLLHDGIDGFVLSDPLDASTITKLFRLLYGQPELRERIGTAAAQTARSWTWDRNAAAVWELLKSHTRPT
jgi:glycosyltransferase involved in cell wall biosynthesis